jgi:hypothetical protein
LETLQLPESLTRGTAAQYLGCRSRNATIIRSRPARGLRFLDEITRIIQR